MMSIPLKTKVLRCCSRSVASCVAVACLFIGQIASAVENLPDSFYERPGLEEMPRIDYASMPVVNVKDLGALGDGKQISNKYFYQAVEELEAQGGGIVYIPKGTYHFEPDENDERSWLIYYGNKQLGYAMHFGSEGGLENIHFVGEGMESVLQFEFPKLWDSYSFHVHSLMVSNGKNISFRDLSLTQTPFGRQRRASDWKMGNGFRTVKTKDIQFTRVFVDQGSLGLGFFHSEDIWVVDCDIRNTRADNIKVDNCDEATVAYNYFEEPMDDNVSMIYYKQHRDTPSKGYRFLYNTVMGPAFGRGYIMCGDDIDVIGNWIERTYGNGITTYGSFTNGRIEDNTLIRTGLAAREGNPRGGQSEPGYSSGLSFGGKDVVANGNSIYGAQGVGIRLGSNTNVELTNNLIMLGSNIGLLFDPWKIDEIPDYTNLKFENNTFIANEEAIKKQGVFKDSFDENNQIITKAPFSNIDAFLAATDAKALEWSSESVESIKEDYFDLYSFARKPTKASEFVAPSEAEITAQAEAVTKDVRDFGAVGDGTTNDTEAFQKAIAALPKSGGTLYVPKGIYRIEPLEAYESFPFTAIKQHILIAGRNDLQIKGDGEESQLLFSSMLDHQGIRFIGCENVSVKNITLTTDSTAPLRRNRALLDFSGCQGVLAKKVYTQGGNGSAILLDTVDRGLVLDCVVKDSGQFGIRNEASCMVEIANNEIYNTRDHAIQIDYMGSILRESDYVVVHNNLIDGTLEGAGMTVLSGKVAVLDNQIENTMLSGIYVYQPAMGWAMNELTVRGNLFENCGQYNGHSGIHFGTPLRRGNRGRVLIENNTFKDLQGNGVHLTFGRSMIWGTQGLYSFKVSENTYENVKGQKCFVDTRATQKGKDDNVSIDHLDVDNP